MSSLQKFHRRTNGGAPAGKLIGSGSATTGYYLGFAGDGTSYMYVAPKSTEVSKQWGSYGTTRSTVSTTNGLANTNTLVSFGTAAHPAAGHCKYLTTGGYNTWYLPAKNELITLYSNHTATPFATADSFIDTAYWSSTEATNKFAWPQMITIDAPLFNYDFKNTAYIVRAVRRSTI
jgi:hypothetical protein